MKTNQKKQFIKELCNAVRDSTLGHCHQMPEDWDGHELREYLADRFDAERSGVMDSGPRRKNYRNTIAVSVLP